MIQLPAIFAGDRRWLMLRLIVNGSLQALMLIGSMFLVRFAFNVMLNPEFNDSEVNMFDLREVWQVALFATGLLGCTGFAACLRYVERVDAERLGQEYIHRVRLTIFDRMTHFAPRALGQRSTGASMLRFVGDLSAIRRWVSLGLARIVVSIIVTSIAIVVLAYLDPYLALGSMLILSLGLLWSLTMGPKIHRVMSETRRLRGRLASNINEKIRAFAVIQVFNQQKRERRRFRKHSGQLHLAMIDRARATAGMRIINEGATALSMAAILAFGAFEVFHNRTSAGNVVAAMAVVGFLSNAFRDLSRVHEYLQNFRVSHLKILQFMQTKPLRGRSAKLPSLQITQGEITLENLCIKSALKNISGTIRGGAKLGLIGDNGAGKSTLLQLIARLVDPSDGRILIDDQDISQCNLTSVRQAIGIVSPDLPLLKGSIRYNLRYRAPDAAETELDQVKKLCGLDELLSQLPGGEEFRLHEGGENLSLGQRHKLALARALLGQPAILIVDEIDANLDGHAALVLENVLKSFTGTVLLVSRSPERLALTDTLWRLNAGELVSIEEHNNQSPPLQGTAERPNDCQGARS